MSEKITNKPKRRYLPIKEHPIYNKFYDQFKLQSPILNPRPMQGPGDIKERFFLSDLRGVNDALLDVEGITDSKSDPHYGEYYRPDDQTYYKSKILSTKGKLNKLLEKFNRLRKRALQEGNLPLKTWPKDLLIEKMRLEAKLDVFYEEVEYLRTLQEKFVQKTLKEKYPIDFNNGGVMELDRKTGLLTRICGQLCKPDSNGIIHIVDERSPYQGMPVWFFKKFILVIRSKEYNYREKEAIKLARKERENVRHPNMKKIPLPEYNQTTGLVTYPGYQWPRIPKVLEEQKQLLAEMKKEEAANEN
mgnify:CR=1 FL=1